jgi:hypothetical protein
MKMANAILKIEVQLKGDYQDLQVVFDCLTRCEAVDCVGQPSDPPLKFNLEFPCPEPDVPAAIDTGAL